MDNAQNIESQLPREKGKPTSQLGPRNSANDSQAAFTPIPPSSWPGPAWCATHGQRGGACPGIRRQEGRVCQLLSLIDGHWQLQNSFPRWIIFPKILMLGTRDYIVTKKNNVFSKNSCQLLSFRSKNSLPILAHSICVHEHEPGRQRGKRETQEHQTDTPPPRKSSAGLGPSPGPRTELLARLLSSSQTGAGH